jgi:sulfotransferase
MNYNNSDKSIFYLGGLPRSGSTLLCNILAQNPSLFVTKATSGCSELIFRIKNNWDNIIEHKAEGINYNQLVNVLRGVLNSYHLTDKKFIIDKSRSWTGMIDTIKYMTNFQPKIIVPVRNINEILASFEKLWRQSSGLSSWTFAPEDQPLAQTTEGRCDLWANMRYPVGSAFNKIRDAIDRGYKKDLFFVEFDDLTQRPSYTMQKIYEYLELPTFDHDYTNIVQMTEEDDIGVHKIPNLHKIRPKVEPIPFYSQDILGINLSQKYSNLEIWR